MSVPAVAKSDAFADFTVSEVEDLRRLARIASDCPIAVYQPREGAARFHASWKLVRVMSGGKRSGKTFASDAEAVMALTGIESAFTPGAIFRDVDGDRERKFRRPPVHLRHYVVDLKRIVDRVMLPIYWALIPDGMLDRSQGKDGFNRERYTLYVKSGKREPSSVQFMSYDMSSQHSESASYDGVILDEAPRESLYDSQKARLVDRGGLMWGGMTLDQQRLPWPIDWVDRRIRRHGDGEEYTGFFQLSTRENLKKMAEAAGGAEGRRILRNLDMWEHSISPRERAIAIEGRSGFLAGLVYKDFDENVHASYDFATPAELCELAREGAGDVWCGLDHGMDHPTVCEWAFVARKPVPEWRIAEGDYLMFDEYARGDCTVPRHVESIRRKCVRHGVLPNGLFADNQLWDRDPKGGKTNAALYIAAGLRVKRANHAKSPGWTAVNEALQPRRGEAVTWPRLRICRGACPQLVERGFLGYIWNPKWSGSKGDDKDLDNDPADALRYLIMGRPHRIMGMHREQRQPMPRDPVTGMPLDLMGIDVEAAVNYAPRF